MNAASSIGVHVSAGRLAQRSIVVVIATTSIMLLFAQQPTEGSKVTGYFKMNLSDREATAIAGMNDLEILFPKEGADEYGCGKKNRLYTRRR